MAGPFQITPTNLFQPTQISGCSLWLDAADPNGNGIVPANNTSISTWVDKSGSGRNAVNQATSAILFRNVQNGLPVLRFNGNSEYSITYNSFPNTAYTIFTVQFLSNNNGNYRRLLHGNPNSDAFLYIGVLGQNIATFTGIGTSWNDINANTPNINNLNLWKIVATRVSTSTLTPFVDGTAQNNKTGTTAAFSGLTLGCLPFPNKVQHWQGDVAEIQIYSSALTTVQIQQIEGYLAWKWGLVANLPANHPFKTEPVYSQTVLPFPSLITPSILTVPAPKFATNTPVFAPTQVPGCQLWLDAADPNGNGVLPSNGTILSRWVDKSGNQNNAISGGSIAPIFSSRSVVFSGTHTVNSTYFSIADTPALRLTTPYTIYMLYSATPLTPTVGNNRGSMILLGKFPEGSGFPGWAYRARTFDPTNIVFTAQFFNSAANQNDVVVTSVNVVDGTQKIIGLNQPGSTTMFSRVNGSADLTLSLNLPVSSTVPLILGARNSSVPNNNPFNGSVNEILLFTSSITTSQCQQIEGYLAWKWGLVNNLPNGHPFKTPPIAPFPYAVRQLTQGTPISPIVTQGLDLWIDAINPVSGTTIPAVSPTTRTATLSGGTTRVATTPFYFDINGSPQFINTTYNPNLDNNTLYTWELWFWDDAPGGFSDNTALITNYSGSTITTPFAFIHINSGGSVRITERNTLNTSFGISSTINVCDGVWHHLVKVATSTEQLLYIDGVFNVSTNRPGGVITSGRNIAIGGNHLDRYQTCRIALVRLYRNNALTEIQIQRQYQADKARFGL
jgi:hypothetical protein